MQTIVKKMKLYLSLLKRVGRVWSCEGLNGIKARLVVKFLGRSPSSEHYIYRVPTKPVITDHQAFDGAILFSIVVPVYNTAPALLAELLASVKAQ